jgi:hypothetical protein
LLAQRDRALEKLTAAQNRKVEQLARTADDQTRNWLDEKAAMEQRYAEMLADSNAQIKVRSLLSLNVASCRRSDAFWLIFYCAFLHVNFLHLFSNGLCLKHARNPFDLDKLLYYS